MQSLEQRPAMVGCLLLVISCVFFAWLQWSPTFADPDSFYHIKIAELMRDQRGFVTKFSWLPHTALAKNFADQAWLYHIFLIPFTYFPDPLIGLKIATGLLDVTLIVCIYWIMRKWNIRYAWVYIIILLLTNPFIFRISLAKTPAVSVLIFLIGLYALLDCRPPVRIGGYRNQHKNKKIIFLFFISLIFTWTHAAWPLLVIVSGIYWTVCGLFRFNNNIVGATLAVAQNRAEASPAPTQRFLGQVVTSILSAPEKKLFLTTVLGCLLGLLINPYFPKNLSFFWYQTILISLKSYKYVIGVGSEWYGFPLSEFIGSSVFVFSVALIAMVIFFIRLRHQTKTTWTLLVSAVLLLLLTLSARRNSEYFTPTALIFSALVISSTPSSFWQEIRREIKFFKFISLRIVLTLFFALAIPFIIARDTVRIKHLLKGRYSFTKYSSAVTWLRSNVPPSTTVFHSSWEDFPVLFYRAPEFRYIIGLDPTFLYLASPEKYQLWYDVSNGKVNPDPDRLREILNTSTLVVEKTYKKLKQKIVRNNDWSLSYEDAEVWIYQQR